jgi:hypothetical protein
MRRRAAVLAPLIAGLLSAVLPASAASAGTVTFSPTPRAMWGVGENKVRAVLVVGNTVYVGGNFTTVRNQTNIIQANRTGLAAFDLTTGQLVSGFQADVNGTVRALATDGNRLFVGGQFTTIKGQPRANLAAVSLTNGNVQPFVANASGNVYALEVSNGSLYVGGKFNQINGAARRKLAKVNPSTGAVDLAFSPKPDSEVNSLDATGSGDVLYAGGAFTVVGGQPRQFLAGVNPATGAPTATVFATTGRVLDLDARDDGTAVYTGTIDQDNSARKWSTSTGASIWRFQVGGNVQAVKQVGNIVYVGHHDRFQGNTLRKMEAVDEATGVLDPAFLPNINTYDGVWDIDAAPGVLVAGGTFNTVNGVKARRIAVFPPL